MTAVVIDASVVIAWILPGQSTPQTRALLLNEAGHERIAPHLLPLEVSNVLVRAERRNMITLGQISSALASLQSLGIALAPPLPAGWRISAAELARSEGLSVYDALYLDLAITRGAALASRDRALCEAARRRGVDCVEVGHV